METAVSSVISSLNWSSWSDRHPLDCFTVMLQFTVGLFHFLGSSFLELLAAQIKLAFGLSCSSSC